MEIRVLGPSGLRVSTLCLGTATFGNREWGCDEAESGRILDRYLDAGGNFLDTANKYADGAGEEVLGRLLKSRRQRVVVGTKYTGSTDDSDPNASGNQRKNLVRSLEESLRRLRTDYLDILWVHGWDGVTPIEELIRALDDAVRNGKVLSVGISNAPAWMIGFGQAVARLRGWSQWIAVQNEYNLLERGAERDLLPMSRYLGLGFLAWAPFAQGRLTGKYLATAGSGGRLTADEPSMPDTKRKIVELVVEVAKEVDCRPTAVALRWILQGQPEVIPVVGARSQAQLEESLAGLTLRLEGQQMERLNRVSDVDIGSPTAFMRSASGRQFMWGTRGGVPPQTPLGPRPWWEP